MAPPAHRRLRDLSSLNLEALGAPFEGPAPPMVPMVRHGSVHAAGDANPCVAAQDSTYS